MTVRTKEQTFRWVRELVGEHCPDRLFPVAFWFTREKRSAGQAHFTKAGQPDGFSLSEHYVLNPYVTNREVKNTILHELAHLISPFREGHGPAWKANAMRLGVKPGIYLDRPFISGSWVCRCPQCKTRWFFYRTPKGRQYRCWRCAAPVTVRKSKPGRYVK